MKKLRIVAAALALTTAFGLAGCSSCKNKKKEDNSNTDATQDFVSVAVTQKSVTVKDYEAKSFNYARYFRISDEGKGISANDYIDTSAVKSEEGTYEVTCTYGGKTATLQVTVVASTSTLTLSRKEVRVNTAALASYDFKALFSLTVDGSSFKITDDMITTDLKGEPGEYTYSVTFFGTTETLKIIVIDEYAIEIIKSYSTLELTKDELADFDFTTLFSLYIGGIAEEVKLENIDASALADAEEGNTYPVTMSLERNGRQGSATVQIKVVAEAQIRIEGRTVVTYPNGENIDLKTLFTIMNGNVPIEVTDDMITGTVDYSKEGDNVITLEYAGRTATATVTIRLGVILGYAKADTVLIEKGTDKNAYDFGADFSVIINGIRFTQLPPTYFNLSGVDFDTAGEYKVKLTVPYNTKGFVLGGGVEFDNFEIEITYVVVENKVEYDIKTLQTNVVLPAGTEKYNVYNNLTVTINGIRRKIFEDREHQDGSTVYAETVSAPIDFKSTEEQRVSIDVYVYGVNADPVRVEFFVRIDNGVVITGRERVVFSGTTVYARDMFTITENGQPVTVTDDMVTGKIDLFHAGIYFVTATYKGVTAQSKAVVLDSTMTGTYKTLLTEIEAYEEEDDDYEYGWGDYDGEYYAMSTGGVSTYAATATLKNLTIDDEGEMYLGSEYIEILSIIDAQTFNVKLYTNEFVMHYEDGIITLDPDNSIRLTYHERKRPLVYFNESIWKLETGVEVNSSSQGYNVLQSSSSGNLLVSSGAYTINLFKIKSVEDGSEFWYGMKTQLLAKYNSDTYYADEIFGFATTPGIVQKAGSENTVSFGGEVYTFTMTSGSKAIINKTTTQVSPFAGKTFTGTVDGKTGIFSVSGNDKITFTLDNKKVFDLSQSEQNQLKNAGIDYDENTWLVYNMLDDSENKPYSYRFRLNTDNGTFTVDKRDDLYGRYVYGKVCFFFDGYGSGEANFNTDNRYATTAFTYKRIGNGANIEIAYRNAQPNFEYGKSAKFLLADFKNILTVREITGIDLVGKQLENTAITDGAIVKVNNLVIGKSAYFDELLSGISIVTKDGEIQNLGSATIEGFNRVKYVDTSLVKTSVPGFYQMTINVPIDGEIKPSYYAVQVLDNIYSGHKLVGIFNRTAINANTSLTIDEFGRVSGTFAGIEFRGSGILTENSFTASVVSANGKMTITGEYLADGIITATSRGALMFTDCFTSGTVRTCGTENYVFRAVTANGSTVCMLANSATSLGNIVEVDGNLETLGSILKLNDGNREYVVKVLGWNGTDKGLVLADAVRGEYRLSGAEDLILDGFGLATLGEKTGSYVAYGTGITVMFGSELKTYRIDTKAGTYTESNIDIAASLAGNSFSAKYTFLCENSDEYSSYLATTVFEFKADGKVMVKSSSDEHDEDCNDIYEPAFATKAGTEGTFTVAGNKITVSVNGVTIVFTFTDAFGLNTITCSTTSVDPQSHGYFAQNTVFSFLV